MRVRWDLIRRQRDGGCTASGTERIAAALAEGELALQVGKVERGGSVPCSVCRADCRE